MPTDSQLTTLEESFLLAKRGEGLSPRTYVAYKVALDRFVGWLTSQGVTEATRITSAVVRAYFAELHTHGYRTHTVSNAARPVKTFLRWIYAENILATDVMARVKMPPVDRKVLPALTADQISRLLDACESPRDVAVIMFLLDTGCRASETVAVRVADVNQTTGAVQVEHPKGGERRRRTVYLGAQARRAVVRYIDGMDDATGLLFPSLTTGRAMAANGLLQLVRRIGFAAGFKVSPHDFRRTFALTCLRNGMDVRRLAALMGHADLDVLTRYLAITEHDTEAAHKAFGPVDSLLRGKGKDK